MTINPIIPIWLMAIICIIIVCFKRKGKFAYIRQIISVILLFVMNLRIMIPNATVEMVDTVRNVKVLFVIDNTLSMLAQDCDGEERISAVKNDCEYIIDKLGSAKYAVISFENVANVLSPYTNNSEFTKSVINSIKPLDSFYANGSYLDVPVETMKNMFKETEKEDESVIVFYISDGEMSKEKDVVSFKGLSKYISDGAVLGYGTKEGGKMYVTEGYEVVALKDYTNYELKDAISVIDEDNLQQIAKNMEIDYIHMNNSKDIDKKLNSIINSSNSEQKNKKTTGYKDIYYYFAVPLLIIMFYEFVELGKKRG